MSSKNYKHTVQLVMQMDTSAPKKAMQDFQKEFKNLGLNDRTMSKVETKLNKMGLALEKIDLSKSSTPNTADLKKIETQTKNFQALTKGLQKDLEGIDSKKLFANNKDFQNLTGYLEDLEQQVKDYNSTLEITEQRLRNITNALNPMTKEALNANPLTDNMLNTFVNQSKEGRPLKNTLLKRLGGTKDYYSTKEVEESLALNALRQKKRDRVSLGKSDSFRVGPDAEKNTQELTEEIVRLNEAIQESEERLQSYKNNLKTIKEIQEDLTNISEVLRQNEHFAIINEEGEQVQATYEDLQREAEKTGQIIEESFGQGIPESAKKASTALDNAGQKMQDTARDGVEASKYIDKIDKGVDQLSNSLTQLFGATAVFRAFTRGAREALKVVQDLDASMTEIAVVTEKTLDDVWATRGADSARATELGAATLEYIDAKKLYYQQGLSETDVITAADETIKMARIGALEGAEATNLMTAAIRGFNLEMTETNRINDVYSWLAAKSAADTREIAEAMTKTASIAHSAGASFENTSAFLTQMIETTREAPENLGTALKTITARFQEMKKAPDEIGEIDGEIVDANKFETALRSVDIALRDTTGNFRAFDDVIFEISEKWEGMTRLQQRYIASTAAGSRQQSRFLALVSNNQRLMELASGAETSDGASDEQFEKTLDSMESKLNRARNEWNLFITTLFNSDIIKGVVDSFTEILSLINKIIQALPSGMQLPTALMTTLGVGGLAKGGLEKLMRPLLTGFTRYLIEGGKAGGVTLATSISQSFRDTWKKGDVSESITEDIAEGAKKGGEQVKVEGQKAATSVVNSGKKAGSGIKGVFSSMAGGLKMMAITAAVGLAISGISALVNRVKELNRVSSLSDTGNLFESMGRTAKEASDNLNGLKENVSETKDLLEQYDEGVIGLEGLARGSEEWKDQLIEVNDLIETIIGHFPELSKFLRLDSDGKLSFGAGFNEAWEEIQRGMALLEVGNSLSLLVGGYETGVKEVLQDNFLFIKEEVSDVLEQNKGYFSGDRPYESPLIDREKEYNPDTDSYEVVNVELNEEQLKKSIQASAFELDVLRRQGSSFFDPTGTYTEEEALTVDDLGLFSRMYEIDVERVPYELEGEAKYSDEFYQLADNLGLTAEGLILFKDTLLQTSTLLEESFDQDSREFSNALIPLIDEVLRRDNPELAKGLLDSFSQAYVEDFLDSSGIFEDNQRLVQELQEDKWFSDPYIEAAKDVETYFSELDESVLNYTGKIEDDLFMLYEHIGGQLKKDDFMDQDELDIEKLANSIGELKNAEAAARALDKLQDEIKGLSKEGQQLLSGMLKGAFDKEELEELKNFFNEMGQPDFEAIKGMWGEKTFSAIEDFFIDFVERVYDIDVSDFEEAFNYHYNEVEEAHLEAINNSFINTRDRIKKAFDDKGYEGALSAVTALKDSGADQDMIEQFGDFFVRVADELPSQLAPQFSDQINRMLQDIIDPEDYDKFIAGLNEITDFEDLDQWNLFSASMAELGYADVQFNIDKIIELVNALSMTSIDPALLQERVTSFSQIMQRLNEDPNASISQEEYGLVTSVDPSLKQQYDPNLDGSYSYTGEGVQRDVLVNARQVMIDNAAENDTYMEPSGYRQMYQADTFKSNIEKVDTIDTGDPDIDIKAHEELNKVITEQARSLGVTEQALNSFNKTMSEGTAEQKTSAAERLKDIAAFEQYGQAAFDAADALHQAEVGTRGYEDALGNFTLAMNNLFDLAVDDPFFRIAENVELATLALEENTDRVYDGRTALEQLQVNAWGAQMAANDFAFDFQQAGIDVQDAAAALDAVTFDIEGNADFSHVFAELAALTGSVQAAAAILEALAGVKVSFKNVPVHQSLELGNVSIKQAHKMGLSNADMKSMSLGSAQIALPQISATVTGLDRVRQASGPSRSAAPSYSRPAPKGGGGGGGGGGGSPKGGGSGSAKEEEPWENSYDWLYNLLKKINKEIRARNKLEWDYNKLLSDRSFTVGNVLENIDDQMASLEREQAMYEQQASKRKQELQKINNEFSSVSSYARYDSSRQVVQIDWEAIDKVTDKEKGEQITEYITELERIQDDLENIEDNQRGIIDAIEALVNLGKEEYLGVEDRVYNALVRARELELELLGKINDNITTANGEMLNGLSERINKAREERSQEERLESIQEQERRLAMLRGDTSGASDLAILQLEKELDDARQSYTDSLIDKAIENLQEGNDAAAKQREAQILLMQEQLQHDIETGKIWKESYDLLTKTFNRTDIAGTPLEDLLKKYEDVAGMSILQKDDWSQELGRQIEAGFAWYINKHKLENEKGMVGKTISFTNAAGKTVKGTVQKDGTVKSGSTSYSDIFRAPDGSWMTNTYGKQVTQKKTTSQSTKTTTPAKKTMQVGSRVKASSSAGIYWDSTGRAGPYGVSQYFKNDPNYIVERMIGDYAAVRHHTQKAIAGWFKKKDLTAYKQGGLVDFTGPAWVDGTKKKPESFLDAQDTKNFMSLRDVLRNDSFSALNDKDKDVLESYLDVDINIDNFEGTRQDYDELVEVVEQKIREKANHRNVTVLGFNRRG